MLISKVNSTIDKYRLLEKGDRVVVAVSGGPDSVFLLRALNELTKDLNLTLIVAHLDHCIRGTASKRDCRFVEDLAKGLGLPFESRSVDVPGLKKAERLSTEQAARRVRYNFFMDTLKGFGAQKVAMGHNADDQAETVLMRLIRGAGVKGLCGIPPIRDGIFIRPLIEVRRSEIETFLKTNGIEFVIDISNKEDIYLRNKIRNSLIPLLMREYNPGIVQSLIQTSEILRKEDQFLNKIAFDLFSQSRVYGGDKSVTLDISHLRKLDESMQIRILRKAIDSFSGNLKGITFKHFESILLMLCNREGNKFLNLPRGILIERRYNELIIKREEKERPFYYSFSQIPCFVRLEEVGKNLEFKIISPDYRLKLDIHPNIAFMDYDQVRFPIIIRSFREGDRFQPMGLKGTKKLKDFFIDTKTPKSIRKRVPLLVFDDLIAWVIGLRIDHRVMVREYTKEILQVRIS